MMNIGLNNADVKVPILLGHQTKKTINCNKIKIALMSLLSSLYTLEIAIGIKFFYENKSNCTQLVDFPHWLIINGITGFVQLSFIIILIIKNNEINPRARRLKMIYVLLVILTLFNLAWWFIGAIVFAYYCYSNLNQYLIVMGYLVLIIDFIKISYLSYNR